MRFSNRVHFQAQGKSRSADEIHASEYVDVALVLVPGSHIVIDHLGSTEDTEVPLTNVACYVRKAVEPEVVTAPCVDCGKPVPSNESASSDLTPLCEDCARNPSLLKVKAVLPNPDELVADVARRVADGAEVPLNAEVVRAIDFEHQTNVIERLKRIGLEVLRGHINDDITVRRAETVPAPAPAPTFVLSRPDTYAVPEVVPVAPPEPPKPLTKAERKAAAKAAKASK